MHGGHNLQVFAFTALIVITISFGFLIECSIWNEGVVVFDVGVPRSFLTGGFKLKKLCWRVEDLTKGKAESGVLSLKFANIFEFVIECINFIFLVKNP